MTMGSDTVIYSYLAYVFILYHMKTPGNQSFSGILKGLKIVTLTRNRLSVKQYHLSEFYFGIKDVLSTRILE